MTAKKTARALAATFAKRPSVDVVSSTRGMRRGGTTAKRESDIPSSATAAPSPSVMAIPVSEFTIAYPIDESVAPTLVSAQRIDAAVAPGREGLFIWRCQLIVKRRATNANSARDIPARIGRSADAL
jgi:hypothetical protein